MPAVLKPRFWTDEVLLASSSVVETIDPLIAEADIAAQIPAAEILDQGGAYIGGAAIGMSAANATDDNRDAAPAATRNLTLRIGFVLLSGEADCGGLTSKTHGRTMAPNV